MEKKRKEEKRKVNYTRRSKSLGLLLDKVILINFIILEFVTRVNLTLEYIFFNFYYDFKKKKL
jgi:hypothetical protein